MLFAKGYQEDYISVLNFNLEVIQKQLSKNSEKSHSESNNSTVTKIERSVSQVRAVDSGSILKNAADLNPPFNSSLAEDGGIQLEKNE